MRIVSLLPSATEIICSLGLENQLVGVSHECDYPAGVKSLPDVTVSAIPPGLPSEAIDDMVRNQLQSEQSLYHLKMDVLQKLQPDLIVTQALCEVCAVSATEVEGALCALPGNPALVNLEPMSLVEVFDTIELVGKATNLQDHARSVRSQLEARVAAVVERTQTIAESDKPRVAFLEWIAPLFNAGHWTPELISMAGGIDCLGNINTPSRSLKDEELVAARPDVLFVGLCGFELPRSLQDLPLLSRIPQWQTLPCVQQQQLYCCDGNALFSRPGPRLVESLELMAHTLHPDIHPLPKHLQAAQRFTAAGEAC